MLNTILLMIDWDDPLRDYRDRLRDRGEQKAASASLERAAIKIDAIAAISLNAGYHGAAIRTGAA
jgi:hypothetical protein